MAVFYCALTSIFICAIRDRDKYKGRRVLVCAGACERAHSLSFARGLGYVVLYKSSVHMWCASCSCRFMSEDLREAFGFPRQGEEPDAARPVLAIPKRGKGSIPYAAGSVTPRL